MEEGGEGGGEEEEEERKKKISSERRVAQATRKRGEKNGRLALTFDDEGPWVWANVG